MSKVDVVNPEWGAINKGKREQADEEATSENTYSQHSDIDFDELKKYACDQDSCDVMIKLTYNKKHKYIDSNPSSFKDLTNIATKLFELSKDKKAKWKFFYFDDNYDRIDITHSRDLKNAYKVSIHLESKILKIYVWNSNKLPDYNDLHGKTKYEWAIKQSKMINEMNQNNFGIEVQKVSPLWISNKNEIPIISKDAIKTAQNNIISKSSSEMQLETEKSISINDTLKSLQSLSSEDLNTLNGIKQNIVEHLKKNIDVSKDEIVGELRKFTKFLALVETQDSFIQHIYQETKKKILDSQAKQQINAAFSSRIQKKPEKISPFDIKNLKTVRNTTFGRMSIDVKDEDKELKLHFLVSDFEISVLRSNQEDGQNVYIECGLSVNEGLWQTSLNIFVYDLITKMYMPIGHWLIERKDKKTLQAALNWYKRELSTYFNPKLIFWDFDHDLYESIKTVFSGIQVFVQFSRMIKTFYEIAQTQKLIENNVVSDRLRALILGLKSLAFIPSGTVKENFNKIKEENNKNFEDIKERYDGFMSNFEVNFISSREMISWWNQNHAKLVFTDQVKNVWKSDDVIWSIYKSLIPWLVDTKNPLESNLFKFLNWLQTFENKIKTSIFDQLKNGSEITILKDTPFFKNIDTLINEDLNKIFNFEELNEDLLDSEDSLATMGLKIDQNKHKESEVKPFAKEKENLLKETNEDIKD